MAKKMYEKVGDWDKAMQLLKKMKSVLTEEVEKTFEEMGEWSEKKIKFHLDAQDLDWRPLSDAYATQKQNSGDSGKILMASKKMYDMITYKHNRFGFWAGVPAEAQTEDGQEYKMIAAVHEFGALSVGIYPRPLYHPTVQELKYWAKKGTTIEKRIKRRLML